MNMKARMLAMAVVGAVLAAEAVVVRKLPPVTVVENETITTDAMKATSVRSSNAAVFGAALMETGEAVITGGRIGMVSSTALPAGMSFPKAPRSIFWENSPSIGRMSLPDTVRPSALQ